ncbi:hypothetical protein BC833DRAFT_390734 [Globomyces pollinis-pini]|nr:hypothetical protein BC833DRAFT_390734 [Globomyces pollinis-pini]
MNRVRYQFASRKIRNSFLDNYQNEVRSQKQFLIQKRCKEARHKLMWSRRGYLSVCSPQHQPHVRFSFLSALKSIINVDERNHKHTPKLKVNIQRMDSNKSLDSASSIDTKYSTGFSENGDKSFKHHRLANWKSNQITTKYSANARWERIRKSQRAKRWDIIDSKRGNPYHVDFKYANLGNYLNITMEYNEGLEQCSCQKVIYPSNITLDNVKIKLNTFVKEPATDYQKFIFGRAENLVKCQFEQYGITMDLYRTREEGFTTEVFVDYQDDVVACQEFVLMKKYLWLESLVVAAKFRHRGIGKSLVNRYNSALF